MMSKNNYASIFSRQMEAIVSIILQTFFTTRAVLTDWGKSLRYFLVLADKYSERREIKRSRTSENI